MLRSSLVLPLLCCHRRRLHSCHRCLLYPPSPLRHRSMRCLRISPFVDRSTSSLTGPDDRNTSLIRAFENARSSRRRRRQSALNERCGPPRDRTLSSSYRQRRLRRMRPSPPPPLPPLPPPPRRRRLHCRRLVVVLFGFVDISPARVAIGARKVEPPPGPDIQYEPDVVDLALPRAVVQQPQRVS
jgi:hypothetical protein